MSNKKTALAMLCALLVALVALSINSSIAFAGQMNLEDGEYSVELDMVGGSGKASVSTPALMIINDGIAYARLVWSSSNYDYMIVNGVKYLNENNEGNSTFTVPITSFDGGMDVIADTTAMGTPHEVEYVMTFYSETIGSKSQLPQEAAKRVVIIALIIIVGGGILNTIVKKKTGYQ